MTDDEIVGIILSGYKKKFEKIKQFHIGVEEEEFIETLNDKQRVMFKNLMLLFTNLYERQPEFVVDYTLKLINRINNYGTKIQTNKLFD